MWDEEQHQQAEVKKVWNSRHVLTGSV